MKRLKKILRLIVDVLIGDYCDFVRPINAKKHLRELGINTKKKFPLTPQP